jgi:hypothetical protein
MKTFYLLWTNRNDTLNNQATAFCGGYTTFENAGKEMQRIFAQELIPYLDSVHDLSQLDFEKSELRMYVAFDDDYFEINITEILIQDI